MGRHLNGKTNLTVINGMALLGLGAAMWMPAYAEARDPNAQVYPAISLNTPLARDAETFEADKTLDAECRKTGEKNAVCLCVTHILKYELTLSEYQAATRLYGQPKNRSTLYKALRNEGFKTSEIGMAEELERSLIQDDDFALRCSEAKAYYKTSDRRP